MDLEMTGLDVNKEVIIEVAAIVTDLDFVSLDTYHAVVQQDQKYLDAMDDWNKTHHKESGLTDLIPRGKPQKVVEDDLLALIAKYFPAEKAILAGNSISQDRLFINKYMTRFAEKLHYRMLDVTAWKVIMNAKYNIIHEKQNTHRALDDIRESIGELKTYLACVKPPEKTKAPK
jgi:oligoribonuclease